MTIRYGETVFRYGQLWRRVRCKLGVHSWTAAEGDTETRHCRRCPQRQVFKFTGFEGWWANVDWEENSDA